jgi:hypothetical protein
MQNVQNMQTCTSVAFVLLQHRNKGTSVVFHPSIGPAIGLGFNREQQKQFAEPDIIDSELKSAFGDSRRADERLVCCNMVGLGDWYAAISLVSSANKKCASDQDVSHAQSGGLYKG